jgi:hypothetical protein
MFGRLVASADLFGKVLLANWWLVLICPRENIVGWWPIIETNMKAGGNIKSPFLSCFFHVRGDSVG